MILVPNVIQWPHLVLTENITFMLCYLIFSNVIENILLFGNEIVSIIIVKFPLPFLLLVEWDDIFGATKKINIHVARGLSKE